MEEKTTFKELLANDQPLLVDFYAEWCGPCKMMMPTLKEVSKEVADRVKIIKVDVDKNLDAALKYKVMGVPTFILFKNGEIKWRQAGVLSKAQLLEVINREVPA